MPFLEIQIKRSPYFGSRNPQSRYVGGCSDPDNYALNQDLCTSYIATDKRAASKQQTSHAWGSFAIDDFEFPWLHAPLHDYWKLSSSRVMANNVHTLFNLNIIFTTK